MRKRIISLVLLVVLMLAGYPVFAAENAEVSKSDVGLCVNGKMLTPEIQPFAVGGRILTPAAPMFEAFNVTVEWYPQEDRVVLTKEDTTIEMKVGSKEVLVNGNPAVTDIAPIVDNDVVAVPVRFVAETLKVPVIWINESRTVFLGDYAKYEPVSRGSDVRGYTVVIDPGHGGKETGAIYGGVEEKDLNLDIAKRLNTLLKKEGIKVYMTRTNDSYVGLYERSGYANKLKADLFVSVHNNAGVHGEAGTMTLYYPGTGRNNKNISGKSIAQIIQDELINDLGTRDRGEISRPNLAVLRTTNMPAILSEVAYMTDKSELKKLKTEQFRQDAAESLRDGVVKVLKKFKN